MEGFLYDLYRLLLQVAVGLALPLLLAVVIASVITGFLQTFTNIKDETISLAGKIVAVIFVFLIFGSQFVDRIQELTIQAWSGGTLP